MNPPLIVIVEPSSGAAFKSSSAIRHASPSPELASSRRPGSTRSSLHSTEGTAYFHALERRSIAPESISAASGMETTSVRSCPTSVTSGRQFDASPNTSGLRRDGNCHNIDYRYLEIAMEVAEETACICNSTRPIETDVPFVYSGLNPQTVGELQMWLMARYNYRSEKHRLIDKSITPEVIALDILGKIFPCCHYSIPR